LFESAYEIKILSTFRNNPMVIFHCFIFGLGLHFCDCYNVQCFIICRDLHCNWTCLRDKK